MLRWEDKSMALVWGFYSSSHSTLRVLECIGKVGGFRGFDFIFLRNVYLSKTARKWQQRRHLAYTQIVQKLYIVIKSQSLILINFLIKSVASSGIQSFAAMSTQVEIHLKKDYFHLLIWHLVFSNVLTVFLGHAQYVWMSRSCCVHVCWGTITAGDLHQHATKFDLIWMWTFWRWHICNLKTTLSDEAFWCSQKCEIITQHPTTVALLTTGACSNNVCREG